MATSGAGRGAAPCVDEEQFEAMKRRFKDVGDCLTDEQLLELADCYHEILRWRRDVRLRHSMIVANRLRPESTSFDPQDAGTRSIWDEARDVIASGPTPFPPKW